MEVGSLGAAQTGRTGVTRNTGAFEPRRIRTRRLAHPCMDQLLLDFARPKVAQQAHGASAVRSATRGFAGSRTAVRGRGERRTRMRGNSRAQARGCLASECDRLAHAPLVDWKMYTSSSHGPLATPCGDAKLLTRITQFRAEPQ